MDKRILPWKYVRVVHKNHTLEVSDVLTHPNYDLYVLPLRYDIAILKLATPVTTTKFFVCLPSNDLDQFIGVKMTASGWGKTASEDKHGSKVNYIPLPLLLPLSPSKVLYCFIPSRCPLSVHT
jgi:hypothetical protein